MGWSQALADQTLQNLPYKIELNEWGNSVLSPASNKHGLLQAELSAYLRNHRQQGKVITECSISTAKGVKVAGVAWGSANFFSKNGFDTPYLEAPELCVEIISPSNSAQEIEDKINLYLAKGAKEVWICVDNGALKFFTYRGQIERSQLFPNIPGTLEF